MWLSEYFVYFVIFSVMGWIYESIFCTVKAKKWENRGFLYGPCCPIYGAGGAAITGVFDILSSHDINVSLWLVFIVGFFGSIVLEYSTSWALEKLFHAYWWDYSYMPLNIHGRVCLPYSICFGFAGILVVFVIAPFTKNMTNWMTPIEFELFSLVFMAVVSADTTLTVSALTDFSKNVVALQNSLNDHMDQLVNTVAEKTAETLGNIEATANMIPQKVQMEPYEERLMVSKDKMEYMLEIMGQGRQAALNRVKGFRNPRIDKKHMEFINEHMRQRVVNRKRRLNR